MNVGITGVLDRQHRYLQSTAGREWLTRTIRAHPSLGLAAWVLVYYLVAPGTEGRVIDAVDSAGRWYRRVAVPDRPPYIVVEPDGASQPAPDPQAGVSHHVRPHLAALVAASLGTNPPPDPERRP